MALMSSGRKSRTHLHSMLYDSVTQSTEVLSSFLIQSSFSLPFRMDNVYWLIFKFIHSTMSLICCLNDLVNFILAVKFFSSRLLTRFFFTFLNSVLRFVHSLQAYFPLYSEYSYNSCLLIPKSRSFWNKWGVITNRQGFFWGVMKNF